MVVYANYTIHIYLQKSLQGQVRRDISVDEILALIATRDKVMIQDIGNIFNLDHFITHMILEFLVRFDFAKSEGQYITLGKPCKPFFDEIIAT